MKIAMWTLGCGIAGPLAIAGLSACSETEPEPANMTVSDSADSTAEGAGTSETDEGLTLASGARLASKPNGGFNRNASAEPGALSIAFAM